MVLNFTGYFATKSGHLYYTNGETVQLKSGNPRCRLSDFKPRKIQGGYICTIGEPALFRYADTNQHVLRTSIVVARFPVKVIED